MTAVQQPLCRENLLKTHQGNHKQVSILRYLVEMTDLSLMLWIQKTKNRFLSFIPKSWFMKDWRDERMDGLLDDGAGLISERLGLMGSAAVGEIVQTRHVVCRKSM